MIILGIETSCDETAAAVVENGRKILSNVVASSAEIHIKTGGIIPEQAARAQLQSVIPVINEALISSLNNSRSEGQNPKQNSKFKIQNSELTNNSRSLITSVDAIAVTYGPGLIGSLLVGVETAKTLAYLWDKPIVPINHLVGHIYANFIREFPISNFQFPKEEPEFPVLALVVSGGHTDLVLIKSHGNLKWISGTRDDAAGEAFDKTARLLGLPYPGGPAIASEAEKYFLGKPKTNLPADRQGNQKLNLFPRPMINEDNFDWSFSGLKTAVLNETGHKNKSDKNISHYAAEIQEAIVNVLVKKTLKATKKYKPKSLLLAGGVAANTRLREKFQIEIKNSKLETNLFIPPPFLCTDNATYIASCAYFNYRPIKWDKISANPQLTIGEA